MKSIALIVLTGFIYPFVYGQQVSTNDFERKNYYELQGRVNYFEITNQYQILKDTIFYSLTGFLVNSDWDEVSIENKIYMVLTYPPYKDGKQYSKEPKDTKELADENAVRHPIAKINGKILCIPKAEFDKITKAPLYSVSFKKIRNFQITAGQLTLPFKLRPAQGDINFQMTTDVTIGAYGGIRKRISKYSATYLTIPVVLGLSFININDNSTTNTNDDVSATGITPGWTWATGLVIQTNRLNLGVVLGKDYASGYGDDWNYNNKIWYSFAIGYSFLQ